jgi:hypothetical protein
MLDGAREQPYGHLRGDIVVSSATHQSNPASGSAPASVATLLGDTIDTTPKDQDLPHVLGHVTKWVQEVINCINKKHDIGHLTHEQLMTHIIRCQECSIIMSEFASARAENPKANKSRIMAKARNDYK